MEERLRMRWDGMIARPAAAGRWNTHRGRCARWPAGLVLAALAAAPAQGQYAPCPPPKKEAAGACVAACPAGYEDRGRVCVYRNLSR